MSDNELLPKKALTLHQPYAWLLANGYKPIENRPKEFTQKNYRGPFWIHAGLVQSLDTWHQARELAARFLGPDFHLPRLDHLVFGAIIGRATITGVHHPLGTLFSPKEPVPWHFPDQYGLVVEGAAPVTSPVPTRGYNGFWPVPDAVLEVLRQRSA